MKTCIGSPARGDKFFHRKKLVDNLWRKIENGSNILIAAPRRVGKTTLMCHFYDNPPKDYYFVFVDTEKVNNENEYYRKLLNKILKCGILNQLKKAISVIEQHIPEIKKVGAEGIEFGLKTNINYFDLVTKVIKSINDSDKKMILMIDEFPQTLENIIKDFGEEEGKHFLQSNRELRIDPDLNNTVKYIYAGSIGLENIVSKMNAIATINDLETFKINPLQHVEKIEFINLLLQDVSFDLKEAQIEYIFEKIEWLIPFHIKLVIEGINELIIYEEIKEIDNSAIDSVFEEMIKQKNHFDHWHTRLRTSFNSEEYTFAKEVLNIISENGMITSSDIFEIVAKNHLGKNYKDIINSLIYDGYINNDGNEKEYRFNSPIVRMWWRKNVAN
jgi:hypothetical protein